MIEFDRVGSTNDEAKRFAEAGAADGLIVSALEQTKGRGRLGRTWSSPPGNLYASFVVRPNVPLRRASEITFVSAIALSDTARAFATRGIVRCKWPNDVLVGGCKIAGILAEAAAKPNGDTDYVVVGFGINVSSYPTDARYPATSFRELGDGDFAKIGFERLAAEFGKWRHLWETQGFEPIRTAWIERSFELGKPMMASVGDSRIIGSFAGLDAHGALLLDMADGRREAVSYGEVVTVEAR